MMQEKIEETLGKHGDALKIYRDDISKLKQQNRELKDDIQSLLQLIQHGSVCLSIFPFPVQKNSTHAKTCAVLLK
jgi:hypothetical protein